MAGPDTTMAASWPDAPCCRPDYPACACLPMERALRSWKNGGSSLPPMTAEQREACLAEIARVEGYRRSDYEAASDVDLARGTLDAWVDYCRDKGLIA